MKDFKKVVSMLLAYFFILTLVPTGVLSKIANAEESIPKFLNYSEGYVIESKIYKDNVAFYSEDPDSGDYSWYYYKNNEKKKLTGYLDGYISDSQYSMIQALTPEKEAIFDLEKGEVVGDYTTDAQKNALKDKYGQNSSMHLSTIYNTSWFQYNGFVGNTYRGGVITPSNRVVEFNQLNGISTAVKDASGNNLYVVITRDNSQERTTESFIEIVNADGSKKEYTLADGKNYRIIRLYVYKDNLYAYAYALNGKDGFRLQKVELNNNNTAQLGNELFRTSVDNFAQDINGNFWTIDNGFVQKFENDEWVNKYEVDKRITGLSVYDDNHMFVSGWWADKTKGQDGITGIYTTINSVTPPSSQTPSDGQNSNPADNSGNIPSGGNQNTNQNLDTNNGQTSPTKTDGASTTPNQANTGLGNVVVSEAKNGLLSVAVNKLDKDTKNVIEASNTKDANKVEVTIADTKAIKEGNGSIEVKTGQNSLIVLPFSAVDKTLLTDTAKVVLDATIESNSDIVKSLKAVNKVYSFDLAIVDGDKKTAIHKFANGSAEITLTLSSEDLKGLDKNNLAVFYYNEDTKKFELMETKVDGNNVTFKTPHFSKFIIAEKSASSQNSLEVLPKTGSTFGTNEILILGMVLILAGIVFIKRKKVINTNN